MKLFVNSITKTSEWFGAHAWARVALYALIVAALIAMFAFIQQSEVAFIYNEF